MRNQYEIIKKLALTNAEPFKPVKLSFGCNAYKWVVNFLRLSFLAKHG